MDFAERAMWATDRSPLFPRVILAIVRAAVNVAAEDTTVEGYDTARQALAGQVLRNPDASARMMIWGVLTNANIGTGTSDPLTDDGALEYVISSLWDAYAESAR